MTKRLHFSAFSRLSLKQKILVVLLTLFVLAGGFTYFWIFHDLPSLDQLEAGLALPSTRIYDRNGELLYEILPPEQGRNRILALEDIPEDCVNAAIATEDANYYQHPGVDIMGILRAFWINLQGGEVVAGGSTITQQTARLLLLTPQQITERTLQRKIKEAVLALRLQSALSKDEILSLYLNQVYFGNLAYGIEGAARAYFHKSAPELSLSECALLMGIIQNPVFHDPLTNFESAKERQEVALRLMVQNEMISSVEAESAKQDELQFGATRFPILAPHFVMAVWKQLEREYPEELYHEGLEVITTVDLDWQETAQAIVQNQLGSLNSSINGTPSANANNAAVVAMDPFTGQILTMLGSPDYFNESINGAVNAALAERQPGSALKPFTYAEAMNPEYPDAFTPATMMLDVHTPFVTRKLESYAPANYGLVENGPVLVREALASSMNIPAVIALEHVGLERFIQFIANTGIASLANNTKVDLSITLGGGEIRLLDLVQSYSMFPNGGYDITPVYILEIRDREGNSLYKWEPEALERRVLDERVAWLITDILSDNNARIKSFGTNSPLNIGRPAAAKTGTTTDYRDNWVMGYTPNLVVGVWVGNADNTPMVDVTGVSGAGPIWNQFLRRVLLGQPELEFQAPDGLIQQQVCSLSGLKPTEFCAQTRSEWFIEGTEPTEFDSSYQQLTLDSRTGELATDDTPVEDRVDQTFIVLPPEARDWAVREGIPLPPLGTVTSLPDDNPVRLLRPDPYTIFEVSPLTPIETQRLRFAVGTPSETQSIQYLLNGEEIGSTDDGPWEMWWTLDLGAYELQAIATLKDGSTIASEPIPFQVVEYQGLVPGVVGQ